MGLRIQNNIAALNAHRQLQISDSGLSKSLERLSSGYRINRAADDAAGLSISQQFRADIASHKVASRNASEAGSLLQVAEGALDQMGNMLTRLKELATQASSANAGSNVDKIDAEAQELIGEIDRIATSTTYAGTNLINGTFGVGISSGSDITLSHGVVDATGMTAGQSVTLTVTNVDASAGTYDIEMTYEGDSQQLVGVSIPEAGEQDDVDFAAFGITLTVNSDIDAVDDELVADDGENSSFQIGAENADDNRITFSIGNARSSELGNSESNDGLDDINLAADAATALDIVDAAIDDLADIRGDIGANQNRLMYASANLSATIENVTASESVIRDVDMAAEMTTFTKNQILLQAGTAMLAQANMAPQQVLSLFG